MPGMLSKEMELLWLDQDQSIPDILDNIQPISADLLHCYTVSKRINQVSNNDPSLIEEVQYPDYGEQLSLF